MKTCKVLQNKKKFGSNCWLYFDFLSCSFNITLIIVSLQFGLFYTGHHDRMQAIICHVCHDWQCEISLRRTERVLRISRVVLVNTDQNVQSDALYNLATRRLRWLVSLWEASGRSEDNNYVWMVTYLLEVN